MSDFVASVAEALGHLYDLPYLQTHQAARRLVAGQARELRGRSVQRVLLEGIDELKPDDATADAHAWRIYRYLFLRYVQALSPRDVARELGISERQARRTYREAVDALASVLADRRPFGVSPLDDGGDEAPGRPDESVLDLELRHLAETAHGGTTDLADLLAGVQATAAPVATAHDCLIELVAGPDLPPLALDRAVSRQIALNLVVAEIELGPGVVRLAAVVDGTEVILAIARDDAGEIRADEPRLAIARRLAEAEGVRIAASRRGFAVHFPAARRQSVLVVDDNPGVVAVFRRYLESVGCEVASADRGDAAVALAAQLHPAAITLDVMMAGQDGWETLQRLRNHPATHAIPVLICSVLREAELARFLGAAALLPKPVSRGDLLQALVRIGVLRPLPASLEAGRSTP